MIASTEQLAERVGVSAAAAADRRDAARQQSEDTVSVAGAMEKGKVKRSGSLNSAKLLIHFHNKSNSDHPTLRKLTGLSVGGELRRQGQDTDRDQFDGCHFSRGGGGRSRSNLFWNFVPGCIALEHLQRALRTYAEVALTESAQQLEARRALESRLPMRLGPCPHPNGRRPTARRRSG